MVKKTLILSIGFCLLLFGPGFALNGTESANGQAASNNSEPEIQWVWGEVTAVDTAKNQLTVKYLDYETDQEKELNLSVDDKTTYENAASLSEIKLQSPAGIDYIVDSQGQNIARNVSIESVEGLTSEGRPLEEAPAQNQGMVGTSAEKPQGNKM